MNWLWEILSKPELQTSVIAIIALVFGLVKRLGAVKRWQLTRAIAALESGVRVTYEEYVRVMKQGRADGKLTASERAEAMRQAIQRAREFAAEDGLDLLKFYAKSYLPVLVEKIISRRKPVATPLVSLPAPELP